MKKKKHLAVAIIWTSFFLLIGLTAVLTESPGALFGLIFIGALPDIK